MDTAGFPKDSYYLFRAEWTDVKKDPMIHVYPYWDFNPGQQVDVRITSNAPEVELFVNGVSQGRRQIDHERERCCSLPGKYLMCPAVSVLWLTMRPAERLPDRRDIPLATPIIMY